MFFQSLRYGRPGLSTAGHPRWPLTFIIADCPLTLNAQHSYHLKLGSGGSLTETTSVPRLPWNSLNRLLKPLRYNKILKHTSWNVLHASIAAALPVIEPGLHLFSLPSFTFTLHSETGACSRVLRLLTEPQHSCVPQVETRPYILQSSSIRRAGNRPPLPACGHFFVLIYSLAADTGADRENPVTLVARDFTTNVRLRAKRDWSIDT